MCQRRWDTEHAGTWSWSNYSWCHLRQATGYDSGGRKSQNLCAPWPLAGETRNSNSNHKQDPSLPCLLTTPPCLCLPMLAESHQTSLLFQMSQALNAFPRGFVLQFCQPKMPLLSCKSPPKCHHFNLKPSFSISATPLLQTKMTVTPEAVSGAWVIPVLGRQRRIVSSKPPNDKLTLGW